MGIHSMGGRLCSASDDVIQSPQLTAGRKSLGRNLERGVTHDLLPEGQPFAAEHNKVVDALIDNERLQLACELRLVELHRAQFVDADAILARQIRLGMLEEQWVLIDDKLEFLRALSDLAARGGDNEVLAERMWERADTESGSAFIRWSQYG